MFEAKLVISSGAPNYVQSLKPRIVIVATKRIVKGSRITCNFGISFGREKDVKINCVAHSKCVLKNVSDKQFDMYQMKLLLEKVEQIASTSGNERMSRKDLDMKKLKLQLIERNEELM